MKMTGFGSRIELKSNPFAWIGDRGTMIYESVEMQHLGRFRSNDSTFNPDAPIKNPSGD